MKKKKKAFAWVKSSPFWREKQCHCFLCPCCKKERRVPLHPFFGTWIHVLQLFLTVSVFVLWTWSYFQWKGFLLFFVFWMLYEMFYRIRLRSYLVCPYCGFDPIVFFVNKEKSLLKIQEHHQAKMNQMRTKIKSQE